MKSRRDIENDLRKQVYLSRKRARANFLDYSMTIASDLEFTTFHKAYYSILNEFAHGRIRKLIITVPPQHGKSLGSTDLLPSYMLGLSPDTKIAIASYSASLATKFCRRVQLKLADKKYSQLFPNTKLPTLKDKGYTRTASEVELVDKKGSLLAVGREGALTGNRVDCFILDDLYKDAMEGNSPVVRENCWEWYTSVVRTRMHNNSQELIVFTRWHEEDLIGTLLNKEGAMKLRSLSDIDPNYKGYYIANFEALKDTPPTELDPRPLGEALWESRQNKEYLYAKRLLDSHTFDCMYQGYPSSKEGLLYGSGFATYVHLPGEEEVQGLYNYTDTADMGDDYLCSICYVKTRDKLYVTDIIFSREPMEVTEPLVATMLRETKTTRARIESNNGGRSFARAVQKLAPRTKVEWFHQGLNKESRILTHSASVQQMIVFPKDWKLIYPEFYSILTGYKRQYRSNRWHDAADVVTGMVEEALNNKGKIKAIF